MRLTDEQVRKMLGSPVVNIEITDEQIHEIRKVVELEAEVFYNKRLVELCKETWINALRKYNINELNVNILSKDNVNIVSVPTGKLSKCKAEEYIQNFAKKFEKKYPEYKVVWMAKGD